MAAVETCYPPGERVSEGNVAGAQGCSYMMAIKTPDSKPILKCVRTANRCVPETSSIAGRLRRFAGA
jgi:hypothetical protein